MCFVVCIIGCTFERPGFNSHGLFLFYPSAKVLGYPEAEDLQTAVVLNLVFELGLFR
jgi:hypothetical protein